MPISSRGPRGNFHDWMQEQADRRLRAAIEVMDRAGLNATREMRTARRYKDRSGNLRSSTGYAVILNGQIVRGGHFAAVSLTGHEGTETGRRLVEKAMREIGADKLALVLVAGMHYAYYVERMGLNVTDSGVALARREVRSMLAALGFTRLGGA